MRLYREDWTGTENGEIGRRVIRIPSHRHSQTDSSEFELFDFQGPSGCTAGVALIIKALTSRNFHHGALRGPREKFQNDSYMKWRCGAPVSWFHFLLALMIERESRAGI